MIKVSVPGKVHLIGEHAVVYNEPAIIAAVGKRTTIEARKAENISVTDSGMDFKIEWPVKEVKDAAKKAQELWQAGFEKKDFSEVFSFVKGNDFKKAAIGFVLDKLGIESGVYLRISSEIPIGSGIGSSASLAVAIAKAVSGVYGKNLSNEEVNNLAYEIEKFKHGAPSGGDNSACCFGGLLWFQKGSPNNIIMPLRDEIPHKLENFVLVYTKPPVKTTGELVQQVRNLDDVFRYKRMKHIGKLAHEMREILKNKNYNRMKEIINDTHKNLAELGVSIKEIDEIAETVRKIGGAAKLCGAGGGGIMLCWHEDKNKLVHTVENLGYKPIETELAVEGCRIEK